MLNDIQSILINEDQIKEAVKRIAKQICDEYRGSDRKLLMLCILKGSLIFTSDLLREIDLPCEVDFMKASSYQNGTISTGVIKILLDLDRDDFKDIDIVIVEDIIDSGNTLFHLVNYLTAKGAHSVRTCTLLDKPSRRTANIDPDYVGIVIPDAFVVGYGLDYAEKYRNLPFIGILKPEIYTD